VQLRPVADGDLDALREIRAAPAVVKWWGLPEQGFPLDDDPDAKRFAIVVGDAIAGLIQYGEERERDYRHAWIDLFLDPAEHGKGLGTDAVRTLARHLVDDLGHHRITIDPAVDNTAAIRSNEKAGFRTVGVTRASWRDASGAWRDALLMELVVPPP
jgi:aminoglycoside 6'-N-acetyltransferase